MAALPSPSTQVRLRCGCLRVKSQVNTNRCPGCRVCLQHCACETGRERLRDLRKLKRLVVEDQNLTELAALAVQKAAGRNQDPHHGN